jgi:ribosomal protein L11 methyltransferase
MVESSYELKVRFAGESGAVAAAKAAVTARLETTPHVGLVDGVVDGVTEGLPEPSDEDGDVDAMLAGAPLCAYYEQRTAAEAARVAVAELQLAGVTCEVAAIAVDAWRHAWSEAAGEIVTSRFRLVSLEDAAAAVPDARTIVQRSRIGFGSGRHATTVVALEAMSALPPPPPGAAMLDVGTGTGVLAIAAAHLGYAELVGTDLDAAILGEARGNAERNGVALALHETTTLPRRAGGYQLIAANILVPVLHQLLPELAAALAEATPAWTPRLVLAGFVAKEAEPLIVAAANVGLVVTSCCEVRGWIGLVLAASVARE